MKCPNCPDSTLVMSDRQGVEMPQWTAVPPGPKEVMAQRDF